MGQDDQGQGPLGRPPMPRGIWALGFVSLFMDVSSEMIHALLPVFLVTVLGAGTLTVGVIEGVGEATASISKLFSGWLSDRLGKRKLLAVIGYGLGTLSKPLFALAPAPSWVLFARFSDRVGKGIRPDAGRSSGRELFQGHIIQGMHTRAYNRHAGLSKRERTQTRPPPKAARRRVSCKKLTHCCHRDTPHQGIAFSR